MKIKEDNNKKEDNNNNNYRKKRHYRAFESKISRIRNSCPKCGSVNVRKRKETYDYICYHCGWIGETAKKVEY